MKAFSRVSEATVLIFIVVSVASLVPSLIKKIWFCFALTVITFASWLSENARIDSTASPTRVNLHSIVETTIIPDSTAAEAYINIGNDSAPNLNTLSSAEEILIVSALVPFIYFFYQRYLIPG
ncbi:hypothetical protein BB560_006507 [Smittium megazygosporum]|uniref:Uncharacterized protein n=1 Tax=Smittium megazygosporum TaxID=133381 RepID=A0A2T9Y4S5_9FUNG|nr:hypothetical protein BB560_007182 [Smittium megazygosporum]PVU87317.1 hypothetical protein BB560_006507 [Smittium megazygosporum]